MGLKTLYRAHDSHRGVLAVRAELTADNCILIHDGPQAPELPNNLAALAEAGYFVDPVEARNNQE